MRNTTSAESRVPSAVTTLSRIALASGIYDVLVGLVLAALRPQMQAWFGVPAPEPPIHADLNALFVTTVGLGYWWPYRDPVRYRKYLWLMGPVLKGAGALVFLLDWRFRHSPASFLLFAVSDGGFAAVTAWGLWRTRGGAR